MNDQDDDQNHDAHDDQDQGPDNDPEEYLTELLNRWFAGDRSVEEELWPYLAGELWVISKSLLNKERLNHTLSPTELVGQLYLKLGRRTNLHFPSRGHFFKLSRIALEHFLQDYAKARRRHAEGHVEIDATLPLADSGIRIDVIDFLHLVDQLDAIKKRAASAVVLYVLGGLSYTEVAEALGVSAKTARRDVELGIAWIVARASRRPRR